ncbi:transketolase family protein [Breznakia pachnodae]|uniref:Transketolase n=1 Tax=Breznakia pachnodae TaxID=265178 RepID=A0ABU0DYZ4_9FIRM|nr:transketolase C-terminal domain-containing protein [Breznakia pachnodae]MDQ0359863.1 transketolase [Breznakia pachnodae]
MFTLDRENKTTREMRMSVVETLQELMKENDKVVALEADLGGASGFSKIEKTNPDRFINVGIAEANMVGVAAGLSVTGFVPFLHTFGPFASRRVFDQVFLSGAYAHNTMNIYGSDPGFTVGPNGGTHTTWEDVALMRAIPNSVVCDAADDTQMEWIIKEFSKLEGIHYVRGNRKPVPNVYKKGSTFELGKGNLIKEGKDVLVIAAGQLVSDAMDAAEALEKDGISVEVIDMFTIKPIDADLILKKAAGKKAVITFENHSITGGLGSAVAEVLADNGVGVELTRLGVNEQFGQVGTPDFLQKEFKLTADDLKAVIKAKV